MERLLIFIKHHFGFLWEIIERGNGILFYLQYKQKLERIASEVFEKPQDSFSYKILNAHDIEPLNGLLKSQSVFDLKYFNPHGFNIKSLRRQLNNPSFLMMGAFEGNKIVGYFFLRFFVNKTCFVGRLIDKKYRGQNIGFVMNSIMYETAWRMGFRCLSTISRNNTAVMCSHAKNPAIVVLKKLNNDYLLVEFLKSKNVTKTPI